MQKILIITASALSLVAIGIGYTNRSHLVNEKAARILAEADRNDVNKKITTAYSDLKAAQEKLAQATKDADKLAPQLADLQSRLDKATSNQTYLQKQLSQKDADMAQQKTDLAAKDARITELESKNTTATNQSAPPQDDLKKQLEEYAVKNTSLQAKLDDSDKQIAELRKLESQRRSKVMRTGLEGKILAVNPSWNFVVISLGDRNGVVNNAELLINRGGQLIGKVRVTSVEPSTSIADIVVNSIRNGLSVQPGDTVIYRGPESDADSNTKL